MSIGKRLIRPPRGFLGVEIGLPYDISKYFSYCSGRARITALLSPRLRSSGPPTRQSGDPMTLAIAPAFQLTIGGG